MHGKGLVIALSILSASTLVNAEIYSINVANNTQSQSYGVTANNIMDIIDQIDIDAVQSKISYNQNDMLAASLDLRGLPVTLDFALNSTELTLKVPSLSIEEKFTGLTRDDSIEALKDWFKKNGAQTVERIMKELVAVSPVDPIAGNPNSLMSMSVSSNFDQGFFDVASNQQGGVTEVSNGNQIIIAPSYNLMDVDGKKSEAYSLPLSYSFVSQDNEKQKMTLSMPISYTMVEGAKSYNVGLGLSYSQPVTNEWVLTPAINYGLAGSIDLGSLVQLASASLTSSYTFKLPNAHSISLGNMVGYYSTVKAYSGEYAYDPQIHNTVFRNALMYSIPTSYVIDNTSLEMFAIDTRYSGTQLYIDNYQEFGLSFGYDKIDVNVLSDKTKYAYRRDLKVGVSYLTSEKANGFKVNFGFIF